MNHAYVRPGGVAQDLPAGAIQAFRDIIPLLRKGFRELELLSEREPDPRGRTVGVGYPISLAVWRLGSPARCCAVRDFARPGKRVRLTALRELRVRCGHAHRGRRSRPAPQTGSMRCGSRFYIVEQVTDVLQAARWLGHGRRQEDRLAGPSRRRRRDGMGNSLPTSSEIMRHVGWSPRSTASSYHAEGSPGPARPGLRRGRVPKGELAATLFRRRNAPVPRPLPGTQFQQPAVAVAAAAKALQVADVIVRSLRSTWSWGQTADGASRAKWTASGFRTSWREHLCHGRPRLLK